MPMIYGAGDAARLLTAQLRRTVRAREVSDVIYQQASLRERCPVIGRSRAIPAAVIEEIRVALDGRRSRAAKVS